MTKHEAADKLAAISLLDRKADSLPLRSIQRYIVVCAMLYLDGDTKPGGTVARWWAEQERAA